MMKLSAGKEIQFAPLRSQHHHRLHRPTRGSERQGVAMARAAAFGSKVVIMDEPTAALGVKESRRVLEVILDVKRRGLPIVLISHNMPHVFEVANRIHIHRLGRRPCVINPKK
jgi:fructose transport system ATP-binding protein